MLEAWLFYLGFLDKPFPALGAGNGDLAFSSRHAHHLTALGAVVIAVLPVLQAVKKLQEFAVFLIPLVGIAGEAAEERPDHQCVGDTCQQKMHLRRIEKATDQTDYQTCRKDHHIQFVGSIAAHHEIAESKRKPLKKLSKHNEITLYLGFLYYIAIRRKFNRKITMFTDCLTFL